MLAVTKGFSVVVTKLSQDKKNLQIKNNNGERVLRLYVGNVSSRKYQKTTSLYQKE